MKYLIIMENLSDNKFNIIEKVDNEFEAHQKIMDLGFSYLLSKDGDTNYCKIIYDVNDKNRPFQHFLQINKKLNNKLFNEIKVRHKIKVPGIIYNSALFIDVCRYYYIESIID